MDRLPDPRSLAPEELKSLIKELVSREQEVSNTRQVLHGQIDALRRELVASTLDPTERSAARGLTRDGIAEDATGACDSEPGDALQRLPQPHR